LWAWKKRRIRLVQKYVSRMLVIFPFEEPFYRERDVEAEFVGHPLAELPLPVIPREQFAAENGLDPAATWIGLLPGSRPKEIRGNLPEMIVAARALEERTSGAKAQSNSAGLMPRINPWPTARTRFPAARKAQGKSDVPNARAEALAYQFLIPLASTLNREQRAEVQVLVERLAEGLPIRLVEDARAALYHARASIVASGTATVEAALIGNPFVVVYRVSPLTYAIAKRVVTVPHVAMANLIAGKRVVPELIQHDFTTAKIVQQIEPLLPDGVPRESMMQELKAIGSMLRSRQGNEEIGAIDRVAAITLELAGTASPARDGYRVES
jgi:lipid-A-disaccharide synthase